MRVQCNYYPLMGKCEEVMKGAASICQYNALGFGGSLSEQGFPDLPRYPKLLAASIRPSCCFCSIPRSAGPEAASVKDNAAERLF